MTLYTAEIVKFVKFPYVLEEDQFEKLKERFERSDFAESSQYMLFQNGVLYEVTDKKIDWDSYAQDMYNEAVLDIPVPVKSYFKDH